MKRFHAAVFFLATLSAPLVAQQQTDNSFKWSGHIGAGHAIRVQNLNGPITVTASSGDNVEVTAIKRWKRGDPSVVRIETKKYASDESVVICALWGDNSSCDERHYDSNTDSRKDPRMRNNDVVVEFHVLVPKGVNVGMNTINGDVTVDGATADVDANTVNGEIDIATSGGRARATNVNGGVRARLGRLGDGSMQFTTVNGNVTVDFSGDSGADLDMETVNGTLNTNFEMTLVGRLDPKHLRSHVGRPGGPRIRLETVNGNVDIRRRWPEIGGRGNFSCPWFVVLETSPEVAGEIPRCHPRRAVFGRDRVLARRFRRARVSVDQ